MKIFIVWYILYSELFAINRFLSLCLFIFPKILRGHMDQFTTASQYQNDDFSPLSYSVNKSKSNKLPQKQQKPSIQILKNTQRQVHFYEQNNQQCNSPVNIGPQLQEVISNPPINTNGNKIRNVVLNSVSKFIEKSQNMQRQMLTSFNLKTSLLNTKKTNKKLFQSPHEFLNFFQQTMFQLKELLHDVNNLIDNTRKMITESVDQLLKFQQNFQSHITFVGQKQHINKTFNKLYDFDINPIATNNDSSMNTDKVTFPITTPRIQQPKQEITGKIVKNQIRFKNTSLQKNQQGPYMKNQYEIKKHRGSYHSISFDDISQTTSNMKKLLDML